MKGFYASFHKATAIVTMIVALLMAGGLSPLSVPVFAADYATINFYPSTACVGVGDTSYLKMYGWSWGALGTRWTSDNSSIAVASGQGVVTGKSVGSTKFRLRDGFNQIIKTVPITVKEDMADCASFYMPGADLTPPEYSSGSDAFSFVFVSDTQGCGACSMAGGANLVDHAFAKAFASRIVTDSTAFVVNGGDLSGLGGFSSETYGRQWLDDISIVWKPDQYGIPVYAVVGNHDLTRWVLGESWKSKQYDWQNILWPNYFAAGGKAWPANSSSEYRYLVYSFSYGNSVFIFTDDLFMWGNSGNDQDWQGNMMIQEVNPAQVAYVKYILRWAKTNNKEHAFIFGHSPLIGLGSTTAKGNNQALASSTLLAAYNLSGAYMGGHTNGLTQRSLGTVLPYEQFTAETGGGDTNPNSYLRVNVNGGNFSVQANFLAHDSTEWYTTADATWEYNR
jgi:hypothetical protein